MCARNLREVVTARTAWGAGIGTLEAVAGHLDSRRVAAAGCEVGAEGGNQRCDPIILVCSPNSVLQTSNRTREPVHPSREEAFRRIPSKSELSNQHLGQIYRQPD